MPGPQSTVRPRPMGGFNAGIGGFSEHLDENAMQAAMKQKQSSQQQTSTQQGSGKGGTQPLLEKTNELNKGSGKGTFQPDRPREVGGLREEVLQRPVKDVVKGVRSLFDINVLFGINTEDTPEEQVKKQQLHQRWQKLNQEQQQVAQQLYRKRMEQKKLEQEEQAQKEQQKQAQEGRALAPPSSPRKGPVGPGAGSQKKQTESLLEQQRKSMGNVGAKH